MSLGDQIDKAGGGDGGIDIGTGIDLAQWGGQLAFNAAQQEDAQKFSEGMYKRRYQMQMADMRKAGLNPILSYRQGPPGAPSGGALGAVGGNQGSAAMLRGQQRQLATSQRSRVASEIRKNNADAEKSQVEADVRGLDAALRVNQAEHMRWEALKSQAGLDLLNQQLRIGRPSAIDADIESRYLSSAWGQAIESGSRNLRRVGQGIDWVTGKVPTVRGLFKHGQKPRPRGRRTYEERYDRSGRRTGSTRRHYEDTY